MRESEHSLQRGTNHPFLDAVSLFTFYLPQYGHYFPGAFPGSLQLKWRSQGILIGQQRSNKRRGAFPNYCGAWTSLTSGDSNQTRMLSFWTAVATRGRDQKCTQSVGLRRGSPSSIASSSLRCSGHVCIKKGEIQRPCSWLIPLLQWS